MPRKRRRFEKLHQELKASGYSATSGPAGQYFNYLKGTNKLVVPRKPGAGYLKIFNVGVTPFNEEPNTGSNAITALQSTMTVQADLIKSLFSVATDAAFGLVRDLTQTNIDPTFYSAECQITVAPTNSLAGAKTQATSAITQNPYKKYPGIRSGGVPYGRTTTVPQAETEGGATTTPTLATVSEEDVRKSLMVLLAKGVTGNDYSIFGLHFIPEQFVESREYDAKKPSNAPTALPSG